MLTQAEILSDVRFSALWLSGESVEPRQRIVDDAVLNQFQIDEDVRRFHRALQRNKKKSQSPSVKPARQSSTSEWTRLRQRWSKLKVQSVAFLSPSDPLMIHYQRVFQKPSTLEDLRDLVYAPDRSDHRDPDRVPIDRSPDFRE